MLMKRRKSSTGLLERDLSEAGSRAAETISEVADHAVALARDVGHAATPALHHSAEGLSHALERAGDSLAVTAERLARSGELQAADAAEAARLRIADASERLADAVRPRQRRHHRVRNAAMALVVVGGVIALVQSPVRAKLTGRLFGPPPDGPPARVPSGPHRAWITGSRSCTRFVFATVIERSRSAAPPGSSVRCSTTSRHSGRGWKARPRRSPPRFACPNLRERLRSLTAADKAA